MNIDTRSFMAGYIAGVELRRHRPIPVEPQEAYLTFSSPTSFTLSKVNGTKNWDGILEWSTDANIWAEWNGSSVLSAARHDGKYQLLLRGTSNTIITGYPSQSSEWSRVGFMLSGSQVSCEGNAECLLDYQTVAIGRHPTMGLGCFSHLFWQNTALVQAPDLLSPTVSRFGYWATFGRCTNLTKHPKIDAVNLSRSCFYYMFSQSGVNSLTALKATALPETCYNGMYNGCTAIRLSTTQGGVYQTPYQIPFSGIGTLSTNSLNNMFTGTGGTFTGTPDINTTYYTANEVI